MTTSSEGHTHCTSKNSSRVINPLTEKMEVQLNISIAKDSPFNEYNINLLSNSSSISPDPPTVNQSIIETTCKIKESNIKIRVNTNNSIIYTIQDESTSTQDNEVSIFQLNTKVLYKGTKATIEEIIPQEDEFLKPTS